MSHLNLKNFLELPREDVAAYVRSHFGVDYAQHLPKIEFVANQIVEDINAKWPDWKKALEATVGLGAQNGVDLVLIDVLIGYVAWTFLNRDVDRDTAISAFAYIFDATKVKREDYNKAEGNKPS